MSSTFEKNLSLLYEALKQYDGYRDVPFSTLLALTALLSVAYALLGIRRNDDKMTSILSPVNLTFPSNLLQKGLLCQIFYMSFSYMKIRFSNTFIFTSGQWDSQLSDHRFITRRFDVIIRITLQQVMVFCYFIGMTYVCRLFRIYWKPPQTPKYGTN